MTATDAQKLGELIRGCLPPDVIANDPAIKVRVAVKVRTAWALLLAAEEAKRKAQEALDSFHEEEPYMLLEALYDMTGEMLERLERASDDDA